MPVADAATKLTGRAAAVRLASLPLADGTAAPITMPRKRAKPMSADTAAAAPANANGKDSKESSQSVQLFQRAHQKMVILQRVEEQVQQLLNQRRSIQDELRGIQVQINEEFDRLLRAGNGANGASAISASRILGELSEDLKPVGVGADE